MSIPKQDERTPGPSDEMPARIYAERDDDTNEKRWYSCKGMGLEYVRADSTEALRSALAKLADAVDRERRTHENYRRLFEAESPIASDKTIARAIDVYDAAFASTNEAAKEARAALSSSPAPSTEGLGASAPRAYLIEAAAGNWRQFKPDVAEADRPVVRVTLLFALPDAARFGGGWMSGFWIDGEKLEECPICGAKLSQAEYDFQFHEGCDDKRGD